MKDKKREKAKKPARKDKPLPEKDLDDVSGGFEALNNKNPELTRYEIMAKRPEAPLD